jgi:hypothetical protein
MGFKEILSEYYVFFLLMIKDAERKSMQIRLNRQMAGMGVLLPECIVYQAQFIHDPYRLSGILENSLPVFDA